MSRKSKPGVCDVCGCFQPAPEGHTYENGRLVSVRCSSHVHGLRMPNEQVMREWVQGRWVSREWGAD